MARLEVPSVPSICSGSAGVLFPALLRRVVVFAALFAGAATFHAAERVNAALAQRLP